MNIPYFGLVIDGYENYIRWRKW